MKLNLIFIIFIIMNPHLSYSQNWLWANSGGGNDNGESAVTMCQDLNGDYYITGSIRSTNAIFKTDTLSVNGFNDIFIAKYDVNGNEIWIKHFGGNNNLPNVKQENGVGITYNAGLDAIFLTGIFVGTCILGPDTLQGFSLDDKHIFVARFDLDGNCIWANKLGSPGDDNAATITTSLSGKIYISGTTKYNAHFDSLSIPNGCFLAMYDENGNCNWVKNIFNGTNNLSGATGTIFSIKYFNGDIFMSAKSESDTFYIDTVLYTGLNYYPAIIARLDSLGNVKWVEMVGQPSVLNGGFTLDGAGNIYFSSAFFGGFSIFETDTIVATGQWDFCLVKYDIDGNYQWVRQGNSNTYSRAFRCSADSSGNVYVTGSFSGDATFGNYNVTAQTSEDFFVARYSPNGDCLGIQHNGQGVCLDVLTDPSGSCILTGKFYNSVTLGSTVLTSNGYDDIFIAKIEAITNTFELRKNDSRELLIYANPMDGKCTIQIPEVFQNEKHLQLMILSAEGKIIQQLPLDIDRDKIKLNIEQQAKGIYNVILTNGQRSFNGKIIFE